MPFYHILESLGFAEMKSLVDSAVHALSGSRNELATENVDRQNSGRNDDDEDISSKYFWIKCDDDDITVVCFWLLLIC